jgi:SAM-dependent methyltransferase
MILDALDGDGIVEVVERDDGFVGTGPPARYFAPYARWPSRQRRAMRLVRGRVLDVGAGAGRVALHLENRGHDVVAIDSSPGAVEACRRRGVRDARLLPVKALTRELGPFDTVVMLGNNLALLGNLARGRRLLRTLHRLTSPSGRILGETLDPYTTVDPVHLEYHERNRARGRVPGQVHIRIRHRELATPWFDYLFLSRSELARLVRGTGWRLNRTLEDDGGEYVAVLEKDDQSSRARDG